MTREIVFDIETTGLRLEDGHRIIEIGCVELINRERTGRVFQQYINPKRPSDPAAIAVHGIRDEFLLDKPSFSKIAQDLHKFISPLKDTLLVAHNGLNFDVRFLNHELAPCGLELIDKSRVIDTLHIARKKFPGSPASLDALCKRFNISLENRTKHGALLDAELLTSVYIMMQGAVQNQISLEAWQKESYYNEELLIYSDRNFYLSEDDITLHRNMLERVKDPLWHRRFSNKKLFEQK
jgi:DNA polymerase-3 subunit epsilon